MLIRKAKVTEASVLTELTMRSKAYWGYSKQFMSVCIDELVVKKEKLENPVFSYMVVEANGGIVGYYGLEPLSETKTELAALFVEPAHIGTGIGKILLLHAMKVAHKTGVTELTFLADPNAAGFYIANGGVLTGKCESSSFPGRYLPTFSIPLHGR